MLPAALVRILLPCLLMLTAAATATAAPATDADIERLLKASRAQDMLAGLGPQMEEMQRQQFSALSADRKLNSAEQAEAARLQARSSQIIGEALTWEQMRPVYLEAYRETYTSAEVKAITRFYESPAGKALLDKTPALLQALSASVQQRVVPQLEALKAERDAPATVPPASGRARP